MNDFIGTSIDYLLKQLEFSGDMDSEEETKVRDAIVQLGESAVYTILEHINRCNDDEKISKLENVLIEIGDEAIPQLLDRIIDGFDKEILLKVLISMHEDPVPHIIKKFTEIIYEVDELKFNKYDTFALFSLLEDFSDSTVEYMIRCFKDDILTKEEEDCMKQIIREFDSYESLLRLLNAGLDQEKLVMVQESLAGKYAISESLLSHMKSTIDEETHVNIAGVFDHMFLVSKKVKYVDVLRAVYHDDSAVSVNQKHEHLYDLDDVPWDVLENGLMSLYEKMGYSVEPTPYNDYGADFIANLYGSERLAVQVKKSTNTTTISAVQEALGAKDFYMCTGCVVISTNYFSTPAKKLAKSSDVQLIDRDKIKWMIEKYELG